MEKLKEFKIKVTPEQSKIVQETLFKEGYYWNPASIYVLYLYNPYLFIDNNMTLTKGNDSYWFSHHGFPEITFEDFHKMFIYDISNVSMKDCINKKDISPYFKNIEDMKEAIEYDDYDCICDFLYKKYYKPYNIYHAFEENCIGINCSECPFAKQNKKLLKEMLPHLKEKENMKNELQIPWCIKNDGSQLFKDTVIKYLNDYYNITLNDDNIIINYYYGVSRNNYCYCSNEYIPFESRVINTIQDFIKLTGMKNQIIDGKREGYWEWYHDNGILLSKGNYKDEKKEGYWEFYHDNGKIQSKGNYKDGLEDGYWEEYWNNGNLESKGNYKDGKKEGYWEYYNIGNLRSKGTYKDGKEDGIWEFYHYNEQLQYKGNFKDGKKDGYWNEYYYSNGNLKETCYYKDSKKINQIINGKREGYWEEYHDNGNIWKKGNYKDGKEDGYWEYYWNNGKLESKGNYENGKFDGYWEYYNDNGILLSKGNYINGKLDGHWEYYNDNGNLLAKGNYKNDLKNGYWEWYYIDGRIKKQLYYENKESTNSQEFINFINWLRINKSIEKENNYWILKEQISDEKLYELYLRNKDDSKNNF